VVAGQSRDFVDTKETVLMSNFSLAILQKRREACRELPLKMSATLVRHCISTDIAYCQLSSS
jgi:hypothetical protein